MFNCGKKITVVPLEVTRTVLITEEVFAQLESIGSELAMKVHGACKHYEKMYNHYGERYALAHDPCTIYYLLHPSNLQGRDAHVEI